MPTGALSLPGNRWGWPAHEIRPIVLLLDVIVVVVHSVVVVDDLCAVDVEMV